MRIVIIGAGVAGSIMARNLARLTGADVTCLEQVQRDDHSEAGTGLNIGPNAVRALRMLDPQLAAEITQASLPWLRWKVSTTGGMSLFDISIDAIAGTPGWRIRWSELYRVLREAASPGINYGCTTTRMGAMPGDTGKAFVEWMQNGTLQRLDSIDLVIAADGRYSRTRRAFSGPPAIRQVGVAISRVLVEDTSGGLIDDYEQWFCGPNRLLAFRVPANHVYVASAFPIGQAEEVPEDIKTAAALRDAFTPKGAAPSDQARWLIDTVCAHTADTHWARMQEHPVLYADPTAPVLYLGDAAHGMVPTLGQGATQAIEDAVVALDVITQGWQRRQRAPRQWLHAIAAKRVARIDFAMQFSLEATDTMLATADPITGTRKKSGPEFMTKLKRLYCDVPGVLDAPPLEASALEASALEASALEASALEISTEKGTA